MLQWTYDIILTTSLVGDIDAAEISADDPTVDP